MAHPDPTTKPVRRLVCCCCGDATRGRQWFNRDTGYGLCADCAEAIGRRETPEEMRDRYGERGIHYCAEESQRAP